uniref:PAX-interacting protein 1 n=1 Tax=Ditylenchus dipsaci TaxID=166011 RepID=A0A915EG50_9BILA
MNTMSQFETHSTHTLERISDFCQKLLCSWRLAIPLNDNIINMAIELKRSVENDKSVFPHRQFKCSTEDAPSEEQIKEAIEILKKSNKLPKDIRVCFEGLLPQQIECLSNKLRFLGGEVCDSVSDCTHLVVPSLERSVKLVEAIGGGKNVVSVDWILQSYSLLKLVDCVNFFVHDPENERKYGYNLKDTILQARSRKVFEDVTFHLSPTVRPSFALLSQMIVAAGGKVERERPTRKRLAGCIEIDDTYLVVVNESDLHLYHYLISCNFPLFNEEFVFMAILRHELDFTPPPTG